MLKRFARGYAHPSVENEDNVPTLQECWDALAALDELPRWRVELRAPDGAGGAVVLEATVRGARRADAVAAMRQVARRLTTRADWYLARCQRLEPEAPTAEEVAAAVAKKTLAAEAEHPKITLQKRFAARYGLGDMVKFKCGTINGAEGGRVTGVTFGRTKVTYTINGTMWVTNDEVE